jgi:hypothetical protein
MVPPPPPDFVTVNANVFAAKTAPTVRATVIDTVQAPVPEQAPVQPVKFESASGVAVNVTEAPLA